MLRRLLLQWFWDCYDALWRLIFLNLLLAPLLGAVFFFLLLPLARMILGLAESNPAAAALLGLGLWTAGGAVLLTLWLAGAIHFAHRIAGDEEPALRDFARGLRRHGPRFLALAAILLFALGLIALNMVFYARLTQSPGWSRAAGAGLAGGCFWVGLFALGVASHALALCARQAAPLREIFKSAIYITLRYPLFTLGAMALLAALWYVSLFSLKTAPLWVIGLSATAVFLNSALDVVVRQEELRAAAAVEASAGTAPHDSASAAARPLASWKEIRREEEDAAEAEARARADRYNRTLRDILRPWEYH